MRGSTALVRSAFIVMVLACSSSSSKQVERFPAKQITPADSEIAEEWTRDIVDPHDREVFGVDATRLHSGSGQWQVAVYVMEFIRDVPLEATLRTRIAAALRAVPGVVDVREDDREVWGVRGTASGPALVDAVARVVDALAPEARDEIARQTSKYRR